METGIENLIQVVNKLQDCFASLGSSCPIDLPQIAVVGEQSAGKSSVLENFVGRDFLPRGSGIVTRRPLVLQLINQDGSEYATFLHLKDKKFTNFLDVRKEIEVETDRITGSNKNISPLPINLRIYSPNVLNLTLIDLPGLTKVPVGDQPKDIEEQIRSMILTYIKHENCLILAVTPAIIDLANSEALKMAREVDPEGLRTIGVITKIDMMDEGTHCRDVLENKIYRLKRGYVGIVNRSQKDIEGNKNIRLAQEAEMNFFQNHPIYKDMIDNMGSKYLQITLNNQLSQHIKDTLPSLKQKIKEEISNIEKKHGSTLFLKELTTSDKTKILMTGIQEFSKQVDIVLGYQQEFVDTKELSGGSLINKILYQRFPYELSKIRPDPNKMKKEIKMAIINSQGVKSSLFTPDAAFTSVAKKHIEDTRQCCLRMADLVSSEIMKIVEKACLDNFLEYPILSQEILEFCQNQLNITVKTTKSYTDFYIHTEVAHINVRHPDFNTFLDNKNKNVSPGNDNTGTSNSSESKILKKGNLTIVSQGIFKSSRIEYFQLKNNLLNSYKDDRCIELKMQIPLNDCRIKDYQTNSSLKKSSFLIYHKEGKNVGKDFKNLELLAQTNEEAEEWKAAFLAANVPTDTKKEPDDTETSKVIEKMDVGLAQQIEHIYTLVDSYLKIVNKNQVDIVSKICVFSIITKMRRIILTDIVPYIYSSKPIDQLMNESEETIRKRRETLQIYTSCKEALQIIQNVISNFSTHYSNNEHKKFTSRMDRNSIFENDLTSINSSSSGYNYPIKPPRPD